MWQSLKRTADRLLDRVRRSLSRRRPARKSKRRATVSYAPLRRILLTDGVAHTLFEEYAAHRGEARGEEETGWVLLVSARPTKPSCWRRCRPEPKRDAGVAHVRFNSNAQALASRIVRQTDRRLTIIGVVHTHPGSLRHPSDGDFQGDRQWVAGLAGR